MTESVRARRRWSLHRRLIALAAAGSVLAWIAGGVAVFWAAEENSARLFDERLRDVARMVLQFASHEIDEIRASGGGTVHEETSLTLGSRYQYQIWSTDGHLLLQSYNAPGDRSIAPLDQSGYGDALTDGQPQRTFAARIVEGNTIIQVAEFTSHRRDFHATTGGYFLPFLLTSLAALLTLNWWIIQRAMRPIEDSAAQLVQRSPNDLEPVRVDNPPEELSPLLRSINTLFQRFARTLSAERSFTASAAHELRTPLAAMRAQAQVALRARDASESGDALRALIGGVDRASRSIEQLLTLARLDSKEGERALPGPVDLPDLVSDIVADMKPLIEDRHVRVEMRLEECVVRGHVFGIEPMVRNLIDNATRYCGDGGRVVISTAIENDRGVLVVDDSGPGIPSNERARVFERFYRLRVDGPQGAGLGLSIVREVIDMLGARIELLDSPLGGLRVRVEVPASTA